MTTLPTTRAEAHKLGINKYFTGKPCANNHVAERYTYSGTCQACIASHTRGGANKSAASRAEFVTNGEGRREVLQQLREVPLRIRPDDVDEMRILAATLLKLRFPQAIDSDAYVNRAGTNGAAGTLLYRFNLHPDDVEFMRKKALSYITDNTLDIKAERARIFGSAVREYVTEYEPEFRP